MRSPTNVHVYRRGKIWPLPVIELPFLGCAARNVVTILTETSRFLVENMDNLVA